MIDRVDDSTGEIRSVSEAAIQAGHEREVEENAYRLGYGKLHLYAALMAAVDAMPVWITTDKENPGFKREGKAIKYASLKTILETVRPHLHNQGIRIRQGADRSWPNDEGGGVKGRLIPVYTDLIHAESGEVDRTILEIPLSRMDPQGMGIAVAYGRRYTLLAALGLATDEADDDGEGAKDKKLGDKVDRSSGYQSLVREMNACKSLTALAEWGNDRKQVRRLRELSEAEMALAEQYYTDRAQALLDAPEEPAPAKKGKA